MRDFQLSPLPCSPGFVLCLSWGRTHSFQRIKGNQNMKVRSLMCGEGNGNPLQYSCLENPVDGGARWVAIYGVAQSWTWLKQLSMHACIGEGHGNPLQYSCLESPRDGGAWWAAVYGVAQSQTWLKQLSSSSSSSLMYYKCCLVTKSLSDSFETPRTVARLLCQ